MSSKIKVGRTCSIAAQKAEGRSNPSACNPALLRGIEDQLSNAGVVFYKVDHTFPPLSLWATDIVLYAEKVLSQDKTFSLEAPPRFELG